MNEPAETFYTIEVPFSTDEAKELVEGDGFSWVFHTKEDPKTIIQVKIINSDYTDEGDY
tara:strand:- start:699 stop:875 length:177 start_codon:yes stop_codon:yes gene_type:complete